MQVAGDAWAPAPRVLAVFRPVRGTAVVAEGAPVVRTGRATPALARPLAAPSACPSPAWAPWDAHSMGRDGMGNPRAPHLRGPGAGQTYIGDWALPHQSVGSWG